MSPTPRLSNPAGELLVVRGSDSAGSGGRLRHVMVGPFEADALRVRPECLKDVGAEVVRVNANRATSPEHLAKSQGPGHVLVVGDLKEWHHETLEVGVPSIGAFGEREKRRTLLAEVVRPLAEPGADRSLAQPRPDSDYLR